MTLFPSKSFPVLSKGTMADAVFFGLGVLMASLVGYVLYGLVLLLR